jgi:hypothetical protein
MKMIVVDKLENLEQAISDLNSEKAGECEQLASLFTLLPSVIMPLTVTKAERPDLIVESGGRNIGIEVTWSCHQGWEEAEAHLGSPKNKTLSRISRNWFTGVTAKGKELGRCLEGKQGDSLVWGSRDMATEWAGQVINALSRKIESFNKDEFQKFEKNWLLIADKMPFEFLDLDAGLESLNSQGADIAKEAPYREIYILTHVRNEKVLISRSISGYECIARAARGLL